MNKEIEKELEHLLKEETEEYMREGHRLDLLSELKLFIEKHYITKESFFNYINVEAKGVAYSTNKIPKQCGNCESIIIVNNADNPKGMYIITGEVRID